MKQALTKHEPSPAKLAERWAAAEERLTQAAKDMESARTEWRVSRDLLYESLQQPADRLTPQERRVLDGVRRGLQNKEIAGELNISDRTVKFHVTNLLSKFDVRHRFGLMQSPPTEAP